MQEVYQTSVPSVNTPDENSLKVDTDVAENSMRKAPFHIPDDAEVPYKWDMHHFLNYAQEVSAPDADLNVDLTASETDALVQDYKGQAYRVAKHNINTRRSLWVLKRRNGWKSKVGDNGKSYRNFSDFAKRKLGFKTLAHCYAMIAWTEIERSLMREVSTSIAEWIRNEHLRALNEITDADPAITERLRIVVFRAAYKTSQKDEVRFTGELIRREAVSLGLLEEKAKPEPDDIDNNNDAGDAEPVVLKSPICKALRAITRNAETGAVTLHVNGPGPYTLTAEELTAIGTAASSADDVDSDYDPEEI